MMRQKRPHTSEGMDNPSVAMSVESQLALDEAVAKALQYVEDILAATSPSETVEAETSSNLANDVTTLTDSSDVAARQDDVDPDNMTYEELGSLGESIGTESKGLSDDAIFLLSSSVYKTSKDEYEECVICCMSYKDQEVLITLPCKHHYHSHCVTRWLKINKACPICNEEVFSSSLMMENKGAV